MSWPDDGVGSVVHQLRANVPGGLSGRRLVSVLIDATAPPQPDAIAGLLGDFEELLARDGEISLVIAPDAATASALAAYRTAGVNRLILRGPSCDGAALAAVSDVFPNCGADLTFGQPAQTVGAWRDELGRAGQAGATHIAIEEHPSATDPDLMADLYETACTALEGAGMPPYEIGNFARPGHESRHLLHAAQGGDYLGVGPGAVSRMTHSGSCYALRQATSWQVVPPEERWVELILTGLRLRTGVQRCRFEPLAGRPIEATIEPERLATLVEDGFVVLDADGLRLTPRGWPLCDAVLARLLG